MTSKRWLLVAVVAAAVIITALSPRITQDPAYHHFADSRTMLGIPHAFDVLSNLPFLVVGLLGLRMRPKLPYLICFAGVALISFGSAYYHWAPSNATLVWDRLPMTIGFMGLLSAVIAEQLSERAGLALLGPLLIAGVASVFYWQYTDDLRPYMLVQFGPLVLIPLMITLFPKRYTHSERWYWIIGWYAMAKILELADVKVFAATAGIVSGHTLKHLAAAWACYEIVRMLKVRRPASA